MRRSCSARSARSSPATRSGTPGSVSVSGGIAELETRDDVDSFVARAEAALSEAKRARRGSVVVSGSDTGRSRANGTLHQIAPGEIVLEG